MIFDIAGFRSQGLPLGGARPSLFELFLPQSPNIPSNTNVPDAPVRCMAASLPQSRLTSIDVYYQGRPIPMVGERQFLPWTARFYNEIDFALRDFFEGWSNLANTLVGNQAQLTDYISAVNNGYAVDGVIIRQFSKQLGLARSYVFYGMYPEDVGPIQLAWQNANEIETFDVTFRYAYWIPSTSQLGDTDVAFPGTYDTEGTSASTGAGSIPLNVVQSQPQAAAAQNATTNVNQAAVTSTPSVIPIT